MTTKWSFIGHISNYLSRPRLGDKKKPTQWPSEASTTIVNEWGDEEVVGKCKRAAFFRLLLDNYAFSPHYESFQPLVDHIKKNLLPPDPYLQWIWKMGEMYEDYCVDLAKSSGVYIDGQVQLYIPNINLSGKTDLILVNPETQKLQIDEIKSVYGFGANIVLGTPSARKKGSLGKPRGSNLMQIGLYQWWYANPRVEFGPALLTYGARDTGRNAEYEITVTKNDDDGYHYIHYQGIYPNITEKVNSGLCIEKIIETYKYVANSVDSGIIPERDFDLLYDETKIALLYERKLLSKKDSTQYEKRTAQIQEGKTRLVKKVEKGDWQCSHCQYKNVCYESDGSPASLAGM